MSKESIDFLWGKLRVTQARRILLTGYSGKSIRVNFHGEYRPNPDNQAKIKSIVLRELDDKIMTIKAQLRLLGEDV